MVAAYEKAVRGLWTGRATLTQLEGVLNPANGRTEQVERVAADGIPCRLSYRALRSAVPVDLGVQGGQGVTLYLAPDVDIPEGSKLTVTQNGVTRDYRRSGTPAVYSFHQEIPLELFGGWA